ncbi:hypothetical protein [Lactobacillus johnsonii]|uniref:hypothetical protein n=1 Tax=Lactobacillus johnsonii TaxID=33959 RepID=UPI001FB371CA|nr:hypothetical protein [Lactobacillus johnsonii]UOC05508.1 hypothetical protein LC811_06650 [Lactobacillus johnsonii]
MEERIIASKLISGKINGVEIAPMYMAHLPIAKEIIAVLRSHDLNYEDAEKALECTNRILLKRLLKDKKI